MDAEYNIHTTPQVKLYIGYENGLYYASSTNDAKKMSNYNTAYSAISKKEAIAKYMSLIFKQ